MKEPFLSAFLAFLDPPINIIASVVQKCKCESIRTSLIRVSVQIGKHLAQSQHLLKVILMLVYKSIDITIF